MDEHPIQRRGRRSTRPLLLLLVALVASLSVGDRSLLAQLAAPASDAPAIVDEPVPLLEPKLGRSEAEADRIAASAWFAQGRLLQNRGENAAALRAFQRAWRYDPHAAVILTDIVPLAFQLKRNDEAARYAILAAETDPRDVLLVRRLALHLSENREWKRAVRLYERSLELQPEMRKVSDLSSAVLHHEMGRLYFLSDEFEKSAEYFGRLRDAIDASPAVLDDQARDVVLGDDKSDAYSLWAESFLAAGRYDEAGALFDRANAAKADDARLALQWARLEMARDRADAALQQLDRHFTSAQGDLTLEPFNMLAELLSKQHPSNAEKAEQALLERLQQLRASRPKDAALAYFYADRLVKAKRSSEAEPILAEQLKTHPAAQGWRSLVLLYRKQNKTEPLLDALSDVVAASGSLQAIDDEAAAIAGEIALLDSLAKAAEMPRSDQAGMKKDRRWFAVGLLALEAKRWDLVDQAFAAQITADEKSKADVLLAWGLGLYLADQYERAIPIFRRVLDEDLLPKNRSGVQVSLSGALELAGRTDEALATLRDDTESAEVSPSVSVRIGWILYHAKRYQEAEQAYRDFIAKNDARHDSTALRALLRDARMALSSIALELNKFDESVEWLEQVLDEYPEDAGALNDLGYIWAERGLHLERALRMTKKAVEAEPDNTSYRDSLGWAYFQLGRYDDAVRELELAVKEDEPSGIVLEHLGDAYSKLGKSEQARDAWQRAITAFQTEKEEEKLKSVQKKLAELNGSNQPD